MKFREISRIYSFLSLRRIYKVSWKIINKGISKGYIDSQDSSLIIIDIKRWMEEEIKYWKIIRIL